MNSDERLSFQKRQHKENMTETDEYIYLQHPQKRQTNIYIYTCNIHKHGKRIYIQMYLQHPQKRQTATRVTSPIHFKLYRKETDGYIYMEHAQKRIKYKSMESQPSIIYNKY